MKYFILLVFVFNSICLSAQTLTREEAIEDIDYFYQTLKSHHPELYCFTPQSVVDSCIEDFKSKCYDSMPIADFRYHLSHLNYLFDYHTGYMYRQYRPTKTDRLFPQVYFQDHKVRLVKNDWEVLSINSVPVDSIVACARMNFGADFNRRDFEFIICLRHEFQECVTDFGFNRPPFMVKCRTSENRDTTVVLEGETRASLNNSQYAKDRKIYDFELYPEDKIAIVRYSEVFGKEEIPNFDVRLDDFFRNCREYGIRHLFFDVSRNIGGYDRGFMFFFPYLQTGRKKSYQRLIVERNQQYREILEGEMVQPPKWVKPFKGNVYVYQSFHTGSAGPDFCACMKVLADAVLVGTE
ncbi:MAG: hypothetical protein K2L23_06715, partial [Odoribacter sp.]|nr:hypothetical protein [Odoribacter sp.]